MEPNTTNRNGRASIRFSRVVDTCDRGNVMDFLRLFRIHQHQPYDWCNSSNPENRRSHESLQSNFPKIQAFVNVIGPHVSYCLQFVEPSPMDNHLHYWILDLQTSPTVWVFIAINKVSISFYSINIRKIAWLYQQCDCHWIPNRKIVNPTKCQFSLCIAGNTGLCTNGMPLHVLLKRYVHTNIHLKWMESVTKNGSCLWNRICRNKFHRSHAHLCRAHDPQCQIHAHKTPLVRWMLSKF